jgi:uncharacterized protein (DUF433 family)
LEKKVMTATAKVAVLTPTEAAVVSSVDVRDVNRVIDEKILPGNLVNVGHGRLRRLDSRACIFISFYFQSADRLTADERIRMILAATKRLERVPTRRLEKEWIVRDDFLSVDLAPFLRNVCQRMTTLSAARALVNEDSEILGGTPVISGTRIPVYDVAASLAAGMPKKRVLAAYPGLNEKDLELAALYAEANPQRGRPRQSPSLPAGAEIVSSQRKPRQTLAS